MILYFSGGGRPWLGEMTLEIADIMSSFYTNANHKRAVSKGKSYVVEIGNLPDSRMRRLLLAKKKKLRASSDAKPKS